MILHILHHIVAPHHTAPGHRSWVVSENEGRKRYKDKRRRERNGKKGQVDETKKKIQKAGERKKRGDKQKTTRQETMEAAKD